jgi:thioester reductase-like protein
MAGRKEGDVSSGAANAPVTVSSASAKIRPALAGNTYEHLDEVSYTPVGNVLLAGCTGFLGIHVLNELLADEKRKIFCLIRKRKNEPLEKRLNSMFFYYFSDVLDSYYGKRVFLIESDITDENLSEKVRDYDFDAVINCAACVKHFAVDDSIERVNFHGVENLIKVALSKNAKLIQVSTTSVAGEGGVEFPESFRMTETMCDFGQIHENQYIDSKLKAELAILDAIEQKGLRAKIIRVGNLSSRWKDGEFQINAKTNGFMSRLKAYRILGAFPVEMLDSEVEFSPIDLVAKSILLLSGTPDSFTVFNNKNCHTVHMANVIEACNNFGMKVKIVRQTEFDEILADSLKDDDKTVQVSSLLSYRSNEGKSRHVILADGRFTVKVLYRLGFSWSITGLIYIQKFLKALETLGFFSE